MAEYFRRSERVDYPPIVRPIFDWSEVEDHFPQAPPQMDYSLLAQVILINNTEHCWFFIIIIFIIILVTSKASPGNISQLG